MTVKPFQEMLAHLKRAEGPLLEIPEILDGSPDFISCQDGLQIQVQSSARHVVSGAALLTVFKVVAPVLLAPQLFPIIENIFYVYSIFSRGFNFFSL